MTTELQTFIEKVQCTMRDLYDEYNSFDEIEYVCPLTELIDDGYALYCMKLEDTINEKRAMKYCDNEYDEER